MLMLQVALADVLLFVLQRSVTSTMPMSRSYTMAWRL